MLYFLCLESLEPQGPRIMKLTLIAIVALFLFFIFPFGQKESPLTIEGISDEKEP